MGGGASSSLTPEDIEELSDPLISEFSPAEIKLLYARFRHLDRSHTGFITQNEMQLIPELSLNPLCNRVIEMFDQSGRNQINFRDFVRTLWAFSPRASKELKIRSAFEIFDVDGDGKISQSDLEHVLIIMVGKMYSSQKLTQVVAKLIANAQSSGNSAGDGKVKDYLTFDELTKCIGEQQIVRKMTIPFTFSKDPHLRFQ
mmetsp:Transcript_11309/g.17169  ORF Transcript_11309/g.17169 Transcript_11309/m.17169 type:complete len:200 (+) Transcript_11309:56-655(+)|eukprot:CAMPEP_0202704766 /NCGR_PEP_ID=MMETSP1385-20130828/17401_1 /ASSEMBLY_ACC=CAM_ASM_000861 /TAXON_ID=933848 /ORGANISM="Elphidium margaritaceum" /LENGTH=199 /DNA_ID=CAMNT_0049362869 /DNA_START=671 /DNA_END=1270 /DNA_ORIENTATION=-